jgi:pimeloyl-ACP methyl ester carboxylesterase
MTPPTETAPAPDTIVLIHGLWMTPRSWEPWIERFTERGFTVLAPGWPGIEADPEGIRRNPDAIGHLSIGEILDHYERIVRELDRPPILMGHSFGGAFVQVLLDRGLGAAGVAVDSATTKGVLKLPLSTIRSTLPLLRNPLNRNKAIGLTPKQFQYAFGNTMSREESDAVYERLHIPGAVNVLHEGALANALPKSALKVDYAKPDRAPLLMIAGGSDHVIPAAASRANHKKYGKGTARVDYKEFGGRSHYTVGEAGWEGVADYALDWALQHAKAAT